MTQMSILNTAIVWPMLRNTAPSARAPNTGPGYW